MIYAVKGDEKKDSETDSRHMYHTGSDANMTEFIIDGNVVIGNEKFTSALEAEGINRSARVVRIWTSDTEPTYGSTGSTSGEKNIILRIPTKNTYPQFDFQTSTYAVRRCFESSGK